eukprot:gb/GECH01006123.1/.p1 GENE.gb/GECH01006123.1/~~gb/GECH01006123.1/.p1  ORF type:complete len:157 (+),score=15.20 gb/GECH01006123.1/:1-471(+)
MLILNENLFSFVCEVESLAPNICYGKATFSYNYNLNQKLNFSLFFFGIMIKSVKFCCAFCGLWSLCGFLFLIWLGILIHNKQYAFMVDPVLQEKRKTKAMSCYIGAGWYFLIFGCSCIVLWKVIRPRTGRRTRNVGESTPYTLLTDDDMEHPADES